MQITKNLHSMHDLFLWLALPLHDHMIIHEKSHRIGWHDPLMEAIFVEVGIRD
jgi:hypothetical protein